MGTANTATILLFVIIGAAHAEDASVKRRFALETWSANRSHSFETISERGMECSHFYGAEVRLKGESRPSGLDVCSSVNGDAVTITAWAVFSYGNELKKVGVYSLQLNQSVVLSQLAEPYTIKVVAVNKVPPRLPGKCMEYSVRWYAWLILLLPVLLVFWGWVALFQNRHLGRRSVSCVIALVLSSGSAGLAAGGILYLAYFACVPPSTPWNELPEYTLDLYVMLVCIASLISGSIARRSSPKWVFRMEMIASTWLLMLSLLHAGTI